MTGTNLMKCESYEKIVHHLWRWQWDRVAVSRIKKKEGIFTLRREYIMSDMQKGTPKENGEEEVFPIDTFYP